MEACRNVRLACTSRPSVLPFYEAVSAGASVLGGLCRVRIARPPKCLVTPTSSVTVEELVEHRVEEYESNYLVELRFSSGASEYYAYPKKVWDEVERRFIRPLSEYRPPREVGALLHGPPGTGKTSMAMILADILSLYMVDLNPSNVLSKWVGESEKRLARFLRIAEENEPSLVLIDDAEWLLRRRSFTVQGMDSAATTYLGVLDLLLSRLQEWKRERRMIVTIATTNVTVEAIDPALRRSGRLGREIFFPLPDFEAVRLILEKYGVEPDKAEKLAVRIVNAGLPMSDVVEIANDVLEGREPRIEPIKAYGYRRIVPPILGEKEREALRHFHSRLCPGLRGESRLGLPLPSPIGIPVVGAVAGAVCRRSVVVATDPRGVDEAVMTADTVDGVLVIPADYFPSDAVRLAMMTAKSPVVLVGDPPSIAPYKVARLPSPITASPASVEAVASIVASHYGFSLGRQALRKLRGMDRSKLISTLEYMALYHGDPEKALGAAYDSA